MRNVQERMEREGFDTVISNIEEKMVERKARVVVKSRYGVPVASFGLGLDRGRPLYPCKAWCGSASRWMAGRRDGSTSRGQVR